VGGFIFKANEFKESNITKPRFYIDRWLPERGKIMIYAPAKSGKSYLCMQIARCIGQGENFIGLKVQQGKVLYIQFELGEEVLRERLRSTGKDYENVWVGTSFVLKLDTKEGQIMLLKAVEATEPQVLILDPLYKGISGDENESTDMRKVCDFLDMLIENFHLSVILIHHTGKDTSKHGRGSSIFEGWVDSYIQMTSSQEDGKGLKATIKEIFLRHAATKPPIKLEFGQDYEFVNSGQTMTVKELVAEVIRCSPEPIEPKDLFDLDIGSNTSIYSALKELVAEEKVVKEGWGKYVWKT
jgi:KaiC/GvpD/RAD55 family RecA-like ATPase